MFHRIMKRGILACLAVPVIGMATGAHAALVYDGELDLTGTGFGTTLNLLALQGEPTATEESGSTFRDSGGNQLSGDALSPQSRVHSIQELIDAGIEDSFDFGVVFNIDETGANPDVLLTDLSVTIFSDAGVALFTAEYEGPDLTLEEIASQGLGTAGHLFVLDDAQATAAAPFFVSGNFIGASATVLNIDNGPENFFAVGLDGDDDGDDDGGGGVDVDDGVIPEPATATLLPLAIAALAAGLGRRNRK